jgi:tetratricopeptide (TPR) repeat protein
VAIVERLKRRFVLARLRRAAARSPSPSTYGALAERQIALGDVGDALRTAQDGLDRFPDSERLAHVCVYAKKGRLSGEIRRLRDEIARRATPLAYAQLAELYRELGSDVEALAIAAECAARFPLNEAGYVVQGEIRAERFRRDLVARDAAIADEALTKVVRLNPQNVAALLVLAEIRWLIGDAAGCRGRLREALAIAPAAHDVRTFLEELDAARCAEDEAIGAFDSLAETVEANRAFANDPSRFPAASERDTTGAEPSRAKCDAAGVRRTMAALEGSDGAKNAVLLDRDGGPLAEFAGKDGLAPARFVEMVKGVRDVADDASRRMDAGALVRVEIEGPCGNVTVVRSRELTAALLFTAPLRAERAGEVLRLLVARAPNGARRALRA